MNLKDDAQLTALHQALEKVTQCLESLEVQIQQGSLPGSNQQLRKHTEPFPAVRSIVLSAVAISVDRMATYSRI